MAARRGLSAIEIMVAVIVLGLLAAIAIPFMQQAREASRRAHCAANLQQLGTALHAYHDAERCFPPAAIWSTTATQSLALHLNRRVDVYTLENWAILTLPQTGDAALAGKLAPGRPITATENMTIRTAARPGMTCPSDDYNRIDNPHRIEAAAGSSVEFARGNYAINGGTHGFKTGPGNTSSPSGDPAEMRIDDAARLFQFWGNGIAGFNKCFSLDDFTNGAATLVALEEVRAGIHPIDPRGAWALGQIASSVTWAHGVNGDDYGPNNQWARSDDIIGCGDLHDLVGTDELMRLKMPCVSYLDHNQNATARSRHPGGVNVLFVDGAVRFIADSVDPGLWHVMHSRETPADVLSGEFAARLAVADFPDAPSRTAAAGGLRTQEPPPILTNSTGISFALLPAGTFAMGVPDRGNDVDPPAECPAHTVRITRPFYLGQFEVTQDVYRRVVGNDGRPQGTVSPSDAPSGGRNDLQFPVTNVTWHEAVKFCRKLSELPEERTAHRIYRLPTEAEWEYACRAGRSEPYVWRPQRRNDDATGEAAGISPALPMTHVGSFAPNEFGLHDMHGNAWEWTADWFDRDYYARSPQDDPRGPATGYIKVVRGGAWIFIGEDCRINYPVMPPWKSNPFVGFRVVCEITATESPTTAQRAD